VLRADWTDCLTTVTQSCSPPFCKSFSELAWIRPSGFPTSLGSGARRWRMT